MALGMLRYHTATALLSKVKSNKTSVYYLLGKVTGKIRNYLEIKFLKNIQCVCVFMGCI